MSTKKAVALAILAAVAVGGGFYFLGTWSMPSPAPVTTTFTTAVTTVETSTVVVTRTITTTETAIQPTKPEANASLSIRDRDWHICRKYPINITIEFKWRTHEWTAEGFEPDRSIGELTIDVEIKLVREGVSPIIKNGSFFVEVFNVEIGPLLLLLEGPGGPLPEPKVFEPKEAGEYIVNKVTFDFDFHPEEKEVELNGVDYGLEYQIEIRGEIDGRPVEIEVSYPLFPWPISIWP